MHASRPRSTGLCYLIRFSPVAHASFRFLRDRTIIIIYCVDRFLSLSHARCWFFSLSDLLSFFILLFCRVQVSCINVIDANFAARRLLREKKKWKIHETWNHNRRASSSRRAWRFVYARKIGSINSVEWGAGSARYAPGKRCSRVMFVRRCGISRYAAVKRDDIVWKNYF